MKAFTMTFFLSVHALQIPSGTWCYWLNALQNMCAVKVVQPTLSLWPCSSRPPHNHYNYYFISEFIKGLKKTRSNGERIISEYVRYGFPRTQRESTQGFSPFLRGFLGRCLFSTSFYLQISKSFSFTTSQTTVRNFLPRPQGLILFQNLFSLLLKFYSFNGSSRRTIQI